MEFCSIALFHYLLSIFETCVRLLSWMWKEGKIYLGSFSWHRDTWYLRKETFDSVTDRHRTVFFCCWSNGTSQVYFLVQIFPCEIEPYDMMVKTILIQQDSLKTFNYDTSTHLPICTHITTSVNASVNALLLLFYLSHPSHKRVIDSLQCAQCSKWTLRTSIITTFIVS